MIKYLLVLTVLLSHSILYASEDLVIEIKRDLMNNNLIEGELIVNKKRLGKTYERYDLRASPGLYRGLLRYVSKKHAVGPFGQIGEKGDFYLEVGEVEWTDGKKRSDILFHGGNKVEHSDGCIMLGPVKRDRAGDRYLDEDHTLSKLRKAFYGEELPESSPLKKIVIIIEGFSPNILGSYEYTINTGIVNRLSFVLENGVLKGESITFYHGNKGPAFKINDLYMKDKNTYIGKVLGQKTTFSVSGNILNKENVLGDNQYRRLN